MGNSNRLGWPFPDQGVDPYYNQFKSMVDAQDATGYANREDRSLLLTKGGTFTWNSSGNALSWSGTIQLMSMVSGYSLNIVSGSITINDGQCWYTNVTRFPVSGGTLSTAVGSTIPNTDDALLIALRIGSTIFFRNGFVMSNGTASPFDAKPAGGSFSELFGSGVDGSLVYDGSTAVLGMAPSSSTYTLTRDVMASDITVNNGVRIKTAGFRLFVKNTLTNNGQIDDNGDNSTGTATVNGRAAGFYAATAGGAASNTTANSALLPQPLPYFPVGGIAVAAGGAGGTNGVPGGAGAAGANGQGGGGGGAGWSAGDGSGNGGSNSGDVLAQSATNGAATLIALHRGVPEFGGTRYTFAAPAAGGRSSAGSNGGSGGGDGGICFAAARIITGSGAIQCKGGAGGNAVAASVGHGGGGGGGGGPGGFVVLIYSTAMGSWTTSVSGGAGGLGSAGNGGSTNAGGNGGNGGAGVLIKYNLSGDGT